MTHSSKSNRPTAQGALLEVLLVLAIGAAVYGVYRGWLAAGGNLPGGVPQQRAPQSHGLPEQVQDSEGFAETPLHLQ